MAALVTVYDAEPAKRRPHDVIAPPGGRAGARELRPGPKALARWLAGSVRKDPADMIAAAFDEAGARDPQHLRTWVVLLDGAGHQLSLTRAEAARRGVTIHIIIDIIHVHLGRRMEPARCRGTRRRGLGRGQGSRGPGRRQRAGRRRDHRRGRRRQPDRNPAERGRRLRPLPSQQAGVPPLRPGPRRRLADRDGSHRGPMPSSSRPSLNRRGQMGPGRRRGSSHPSRSHQQRRLRRVLAIPPQMRAQAALPRH